MSSFFSFSFFFFFFHLDVRISSNGDCCSECHPPAVKGPPHPLSWTPRDGKTMEVKTFSLPTLLSFALSFFFCRPQFRFSPFGIFIFSLYRQFFLFLFYFKTPHLSAAPPSGNPSFQVLRGLRKTRYALFDKAPRRQNECMKMKWHPTQPVHKPWCLASEPLLPNY